LESEEEVEPDDAASEDEESDVEEEDSSKGSSDAESGVEEEWKPPMKARKKAK
jgi:hypothetical protein